MKRASIFTVVFMIAFTATAWAADAVTGSEGSLLDLAKPVYDAFTKGHYLYAGMLALVLAVALTKRYVTPRVPFLQGDIGGSLLTLILSFAGALATSLAGGVGVSFAMVKTAAMIAAGAAGGYSLVKRLIIDPILRPLAAKAPAWTQPLFSLIFFIFDRPSPVAVAEAAGDEAVKNNPPTGTEGATGKPTEIE